MTIREITQGSFTISTDPSRLQIDTICGFLSRSHWAANRPRSVVIKSIKNSLCYGIYDRSRQVAFARLVTDYATFAYLCDVFVDEAYRSRGLSKWLMTTIMDNPDLKGLRRFVLATKDAHGLYARFGFKSLEGEEQRRFMSILRDDV